jgi:HAD superfamily hydrolase (TIGR01509 family)
VTDAVVFDLDGVIVETERLWDEARAELAAEQGIPWGPGSHRPMMGMNTGEWAAHMASLGFRGTTDEIARGVLDRLAAGYRRSLPLVPGASEAVRRLHGAGLILGVASSSSRDLIELVLELAGLREHFAAVVSSEEVPHGKPSPDVWLEACARLGVTPARACAVEDSANGIRSAHAAGLRVVAIPSSGYPPGTDALAEADLVLASIEALDLAAVGRVGSCS